MSQKPSELFKDFKCDDTQLEIFDILEELDKKFISKEVVLKELKKVRMTKKDCFGKGYQEILYLLVDKIREFELRIKDGNVSNTKKR